MALHFIHGQIKHLSTVYNCNIQIMFQLIIQSNKFDYTHTHTQFIQFKVSL